MFTKSKETHLNFRDLSRMREIAVVFFEEGFDVFCSLEWNSCAVQ